MGQEVLFICESDCRITQYTLDGCFDDWPSKLCQRGDCLDKFLFMRDSCHGENNKVGDEWVDIAEWAGQTMDSVSCDQSPCEAAWFQLMSGVCGDNYAENGGCQEGTECSNALGRVKESCGEDDYIP